MSNREIMAQLQANMREGDTLMSRALFELSQMSEIIDDIENLFRLRSVALSATASFIVESKALIEETRAAEVPAQHVYHQ